MKERRAREKRKSKRENIYRREKSETKNTNIARRLPDYSRNSFVDLQSKKTVKRTDQKNCLLIQG